MEKLIMLVRKCVEACKTGISKKNNKKFSVYQCKSVANFGFEVGLAESSKQLADVPLFSLCLCVIKFFKYGELIKLEPFEGL